MVPQALQSFRGARRPPSAGLRALTVLVVIVLTTPQYAMGQRVSGRLLDLQSNEPIPGGRLAIIGSGRSEIAAVITDDQGRWTFQALEPGIYQIAASRIAYQPWVSGPFEIAQGDDLESVFHLRPLAFVLDPIEVRAAALRRHLASAGFYERQRGNFGHFIGPEDIDRRSASRVTDLLTAVPGVNLASTSEGGVGPRHVQLRGSNLSQGGLCRPRVYVDGLMYSRGDSRPVRLREGEETEQFVDNLERMDQGLSLDDIGHPSMIAAVEVYRSASQVPVQFGGASIETLCGVIVIWTRTGASDGGSGF